MGYCILYDGLHSIEHVNGVTLFRVFVIAKELFEHIQMLFTIEQYGNFYKRSVALYFLGYPYSKTVRVS